MPLVVVASACNAGESIPTVGIYKLDDQRLTGDTSVVVGKGSFDDVTALVTIDTQGNVVATTVIDNYQKLDPEPAIALVEKWTFRPQMFDGRPVYAVGRVSVTYNGPPIPPNPSIAFPDSTPGDTAITLERGACYGSCPAYRVTLRGDGLVDFDMGGDSFKGTAAQVHLEYNGHNVLLPGRHMAQVDPAEVADLMERFRAIKFFGLRNEYRYAVTDSSTQILSVRVGKERKSVTDYVGVEAGMPLQVRDLEDAVDKVAGTARWVNGNAETLTYLDAAKFDYQSQAGARLALAAAWKLNDYRPEPGLEALVIGLVDRGVPLGHKVKGVSVGAVLLHVAARQGKEALFAKLQEHDVLAGMPRAAINDAFSAVGCSPNIARALVKGGADPRVNGENGTALTALRGGAATCEDRPDKMLEMARTLIEFGVPLEARDGLGWTALMGCDSPELARFLLAKGADPNARTNDGTTPVLATDDDRVALILLRAGADPRAHNDRGTVRANAIKGHWPATLAWLDEHGVP